MATNAQLIRKLATGQQLLESEIQQLERALDGYDNYSGIVRDNSVIGSRELNIPTTFNIIYSTIIDTDVASLEITIPGNYKHLLIMGQGRINGSGGQAAVMSLVQFNEDTAGNYVWGHMIHVNTTVSGVQDVAATSIPFIYMIADGWAAGNAGTAFMFIPHYRSAYYKSVLTVGAIYGTNTNTAVRQGNWKNDDPIERIKIFPDPTYASAKIEAGSLISIYGIV